MKSTNIKNAWGLAESERAASLVSERNSNCLPRVHGDLDSLEQLPRPNHSSSWGSLNARNDVEDRSLDKADTETKEEMDIEMAKKLSDSWRSNLVGELRNRQDWPKKTLTAKDITTSQPASNSSENATAIPVKKKTTGPMHNTRYKAKMCKNWIKLSSCPYFEKCQFAHGAHEVEKWANRRARFKNENRENSFLKNQSVDSKPLRMDTDEETKNMEAENNDGRQNHNQPQRAWKRKSEPGTADTKLLPKSTLCVGQTLQVENQSGSSSPYHTSHISSSNHIVMSTYPNQTDYIDKQSQESKSPDILHNLGMTLSEIGLFPSDASNDSGKNLEEDYACPLSTFNTSLKENYYATAFGTDSLGLGSTEPFIEQQTQGLFSHDGFQGFQQWSYGEELPNTAHLHSIAHQRNYEHGFLSMSQQETMSGHSNQEPLEISAMDHRKTKPMAILGSNHANSALPDKNLQGRVDKQSENWDSGVASFGTMPNMNQNYFGQVIGFDQALASSFKRPP